MFFIQYFVILILLTTNTFPSKICDLVQEIECNCGPFSRPALLNVHVIDPSNSTETRRDYYSENTTLVYSCKNGSNLLVGNKNRQCIDGHWVGPVPRCGKFE